MYASAPPEGLFSNCSIALKNICRQNSLVCSEVVRVVERKPCSLRHGHYLINPFLTLPKFSWLDNGYCVFHNFLCTLIVMLRRNSWLREEEIRIGNLRLIPDHKEFQENETFLEFQVMCTCFKINTFVKYL